MGFVTGSKIGSRFPKSVEVSGILSWNLNVAIITIQTYIGIKMRRLHDYVPRVLSPPSLTRSNEVSI